jgi:hypothetical protein
MAKQEGITLRCIYCRRTWTISLEAARGLIDNPPCPNQLICAGFGIPEEVTVRSASLKKSPHIQ